MDPGHELLSFRNRPGDQADSDPFVQAGLKALE